MRKQGRRIRGIMRKKGDVYTASRGFGVLFREAIPNDNRKSQLRKEITTKSHTTDIKAQ